MRIGYIICFVFLYIKLLAMKIAAIWRCDYDWSKNKFFSTNLLLPFTCNGKVYERVYYICFALFTMNGKMWINPYMSCYLQKPKKTPNIQPLKRI